MARGDRSRLTSRRLLFTGTGILLIATLNPVTLEAWWFRSRFVSPGAALRVWCWDLSVLAVTIAAVFFAGHRAAPRQDQGRPTPPLGARILLAIAACLVSVLLLEGILRLIPGDTFPESLRRELYWRERHRQLFTSTVADPIHVFSPTLGWTVRPNLRTDGVTSNSRGVRGTHEYTSEPPRGMRRIVCVGDSFTFGERLRDEETMPARLEVELNAGGAPRWEVVNLGVVGYGTDQQWLLLSQDGLRYQPDIVVLSFFEENLERNVLSFRDYAKPYFTLERGRLTLRNVPVPAPDEILARPPRLPRSYLLSFARTLFGDFRLSVSVGELSATDVGRVTLAILDAMRDAVQDRRAAFVLMTIPRPILPRGSDTELMLAKWAQRTATPFLDLRTAYLELPAAERERLYSGHWTAHGAAVTARLLAEKLRSLGPD